MSIGYVAQVFPHLTMTFVYREVVALRALGFHVQTFSIWKPNPDELSEESRALIRDTFYIISPEWSQLFLSHVIYIINRPRQYLRTLGFCIFRKYKSLRNRIRTLIHFCEAVHLAKEVENREIKHLHAHFAENPTTLAMFVSRLNGITFSFTAHAKDIFCNPILLPEKIQEAQFIIAISEYNRQFLHKTANNAEVLKKIHLVHCGIDVGKFSPPKRRPHSNQPVILSVGRLVEKKGFPYLINACEILVEHNHSFHCYIIGAGPQEELLKQIIKENRLSKNVSIVGAVFQEKLKDYIAKSDVFVLPCIEASDRDMDGIPNTLMEAMAMEVPTISTDISGIPELIEDMKTGLLVPAKDEVSLAKAIATLLENEELRSVLGKAGRAKVVDDFELTKNVERLLGIFESYCGSNSYVQA